ncbi:ROK family protein [Sciscionella marina]|uniref:ROK family protein n=1 Tax=Sciscionella marina TaxID=508770 RepID=UPI00058EF3E0|nr:ROK family transcriptional regulator [Sciscionella marina]
MVETADTRVANRSSVLAVLLASGRRSRPELGRATELSPATVSRVVEDLLEEGLIREGAPVETGKRGRQAVALEAATERGVACGVDLGGTTCRLLGTDLVGGTPRYTTAATPQGSTAGELADWLAERIGGLAAQAAHTERVTVLGLPGAVAADGRTVRGATNLPQINGTEFTSRLRERLGGTVTFDNDANLALEGELRHGAASGAQDAVMFTIGHGFGAGVALGRRVLGGRTGLVGEFGFLPFEGESVERLVSAEGLIESSRETRYPVTTAEGLFRSRKYAHRPVLERFERALGFVLTAVTMAYEPELVVLGGRVSESIGADMRERIRARAQDGLPECPRLVAPELGDRAGAIGAVARALAVLHTRFGVETDTALALGTTLDIGLLLNNTTLGEEGEPCS